MDAPPVRGALVCNIGDMLDRLTGGWYRSTPHRVRNLSGHGRLSFPFFLDPGFAAARPHGIHLEAGSCNGQPAFATYEPDTEGRLAVTGLQILQLADAGGQPLITALASYRDPALAIRCGMPAVLQ